MNPKPETFYSHGKLLLTGEYVVLDGALALALPTKLGQHLTVESIEESKIHWKSLDENRLVWFEDDISIRDILSNSSNTNNEISNRLIQILHEANQLNPEFLSESKGFRITTKLDFPKNWGLGTSSTLINNISNWANIDAYSLLAKTFGGSGYDIACAQSDGPITYQLTSNNPEVKQAHFQPSFKENIWFVYLNKKQDSRKGIAHYKNNRSDISNEILKFNSITYNMINCDRLMNFQQLMNEHEHLISNIIKQKPVKEQLFSDFDGSIKSLGAWGGDFVMVATKKNPSDYFKSKGLGTILNYAELIE